MLLGLRREPGHGFAYLIGTSELAITMSQHPRLGRQSLLRLLEPALLLDIVAFIDGCA